MSHANEFWNFDNADRDENGKFLPLFPHNLGRALHHPEQDYNANLIGQIIKGYRVIGSGAEGEMTTSDLELGIKLHKVETVDADYLHYTGAGAKVDEWIWVPAEMGGTASSPLNVIGSITQPNECAGTPGSINLQGMGGTPTYEFAISSQSQSTAPTTMSAVNTFPNLSDGLYRGWVKDSFNIADYTDFTITTINSFTYTNTNSSTTQFNGTDGTVTVEIQTGVTAPYTLRLLQSSTLVEVGTLTSNGIHVFENLGAGTYDIEVIDTVGCQIDQQSIVSQPAVLNGQVAIDNASCNGYNHGLEFINVTGGTPSYQYSIDGGINFQSSNTFVISSSISVVYPQIMDSTGDVKTLPSQSLINPAYISNTTSSTGYTCYSSTTATISVVVNGGYSAYPNYQYSIDGGSSWIPAGTNNSFTFQTTLSGSVDIATRRVGDISAGEIGCQSIASSVLVVRPDEITFDKGTTPNTSCSNIHDGTIAVSNIQGLTGANYEIHVNFLDDAYTSVTSSNLPSDSVLSLEDGDYSMYIKDVASGCTSAIVIVTVASLPNTFSASMNQLTQILCADIDTADVEFSRTSGGTAPFYYTLEDVTNNIIIDNNLPMTSATMQQSGLYASNFQYTIVESGGCQATVGFTISQPPALSANISSSVDESTPGSNDGEITVGETGGVPSYEYSIDDGATWLLNPTFTGLTGGTYLVRVKDSNGCISTAISHIISTSGSAMTIGSVNVGTISCYGGTAAITINAANGSGNFLYTINNGTTWNPSNTMNVAAGSYDIGVQDTVSGAEVWYSGNTIIVTEPIDFTTSAPIVTDGDCDNPATVEFSAVSAVQPTISIDGSNKVLMVADAGVTDGWTYLYTDTTGQNGVNVPFTIDSESCGAKSNTVSWTTIQPIVLISQLTSTPVCPNEDWVYDVSITGGVGPFNYSLDNGSLIQLNAGTNTITVPQTVSGVTLLSASDDNSTCNHSYNITSYTITPLIVTASATVASCFGGSSYISGTITGGRAQNNHNQYMYEYSSDNGSTFTSNMYNASAPNNGDFSFPVIADGNYIIRAYRIDAGSVVDTTTFTCMVDSTTMQVILPTQISVGTPSGINPTGCNTTDGYISVVVTGGTGPYEFSTTGQNGTYSPITIANGYYTITNLDNGSFSLWVKDSGGCKQFIGAVTLADPSFAPNVTSHEYIGCWSGADGQSGISFSAVINPSDIPATGLEYSIDNGVTWHTSFHPAIPIPGENMTSGSAKILKIKDIATQCVYNFTTTKPVIQPITNTGVAVNADEITVTGVTGGWAGMITVTIWDPISSVVVSSLTQAGGTYTFTLLANGTYDLIMEDSEGCTITDATQYTINVAAPVNDQFYFIHGGSGTFPFEPTGVLTAANPTYYTYDGGAWTTTSDFGVSLADMIANSGTTQGSQPYPTIGSFNFTGPMTGDNGATTWTYPVSSINEYYYVVVPVGSNYTENLTTATILQDTGNGFGTDANGAKAFTMNGNGYILYKLAVNANTVSATWAFV